MARKAEVAVIRKGNHIEVHFDYDKKLIEIMRMHKGWFKTKPVKHWQFKNTSEKNLVDTLKDEGYFVRIFRKKKKNGDSNVLSVLGKCKKCGEYAWISNGLCRRCKGGE